MLKARSKASPRNWTNQELLDPGTSPCLVLRLEMDASSSTESEAQDVLVPFIPKKGLSVATYQQVFIPELLIHVRLPR